MPSKKTHIDGGKKKKPPTKPTQGKTGSARVKPSVAGLSAVPSALEKSDRKKSHGDQVMEDVQAQIAQKAHELYEQRGRLHGYDLEDWLEAERHVIGDKSRS